MAGLLIGIGAMTHSPFRTAVGCCARNGAALITRTDSRVSSHRILNIKSVQAATSKNIAKHRVERTGWRAHHKQRLSLELEPPPRLRALRMLRKIFLSAQPPLLARRGHR